MNVLYEEDGTFKAGNILAEQGGALQVESSSGKRTKVKAAQVLIEFKEPAPAELLRAAQESALGIDLDFLWECAPQAEFGFEELGQDYFGHPPTPIESAALLIRLHGAPMYFYRKGRGRYRPAPADALKAALASIEKKRLQVELQAQYTAELLAGRLPPAIADHAVDLLFRPDKGSIEYKALEAAASEARTTPARMLLAVGAIASPKALHEMRFLRTHFPRGTGFAPVPCEAVSDLPAATVRAFSIDDETTTEIDDAFSVTASQGGWRIGIHIAAPSLSIGRGSVIDELARERYSTVYAPGEKITMLPESVIDAYTLAEGRRVPAVSLYVDLDGEMVVQGTHTTVESIDVAVNLRHNLLDEVVTVDALEGGGAQFSCATELSVLWRFSKALREARQVARIANGLRPETVSRTDFSYYVDDRGMDSERVRIVARRRDAPLDMLVAELMIFANSTWGLLLAQADVPGIYRAQQGAGPQGRVRMLTQPAPHRSLGVEQYAWSTSPLRRYVDLVNQRQIVAVVRGEAPPYARNDADLFAVVSGFEAAYAAYAEFQDIMERYWCLRWISQEGLRIAEARVMREDWVRLDVIPLALRVPGLPSLPRSTLVEVELLSTDLVDLAVETRLVAIIEEVDEDVAEEGEAAAISEGANAGVDA